MSTTKKVKGLRERLRDGETIIVAEGYLFEFQSRGYLKAGAYVPEVVLERPDLVKILHEEFVHAGSDVVLAFTYYGHREKLRLIGREDDLEPLNRKALQIARQVADETGTLMAGNLSNSTIFKPDETVKRGIFSMFEEQIRWAVEEGADFIVAETFEHIEEAELALKAIKTFGNGLPAVVTLANTNLSSHWNGKTAAEACQLLEDQGADIVGLNCAMGPGTIIKPMEEARKICKGPLACLPVVYRTSDSNPSFQSLNDIDNPSATAFPVNLDAWLCSYDQIIKFGQSMKALGVQYMGLCCGNRAHYTRALAETLGKTPPSGRYAPDMSQHYSRMADDRHQFTNDSFKKEFKTTA